MRRESATVVGLTGEITGSLLAALGRSGNVSIARPPAGADAAAWAALLLDALRSLEHGPWWPPLDELLDAVRHFYAGALAESAAAE
jgi:hypothetical protein